MALFFALYLFGTSINALNSGAHDLPSFEASAINQIKHPVLKADYNKLNQ